MLLSMTGYGRASSTYEAKTITIEIRSLNSKFTDIRLKLPQNYKEKEQELIKIASGKMERGKIDINIDVKSPYGDEEFSLNVPLFKKYSDELSKLGNSLGIAQDNMMATILKLPHVVFPVQEALDEEEWNTVKNTLKQATKHFNEFRHVEGLSLIHI